MVDEPVIIKEEESKGIRGQIGDFVSRLGIVGELLTFLWEAKMWWLIPMVIALLAFMLILVLASAGPGGPMIYTLF